jgi:hypothetical protein
MHEVFGREHFLAFERCSIKVDNPLHFGASKSTSIGVEGDTVRFGGEHHAYPPYTNVFKGDELTSMEML